MKVLELHKKQMEWWKKKLGIDDYAVAWIAFIKGLIDRIMVPICSPPIIKALNSR